MTPSPRSRACRRGSAGRSLGRARAAPSRPGRRACGRAGRGPRRGYCGVGECGVAGGTGRGLGTALATDLDAHHLDGSGAELLGELRRVGSDPGRVVLQPVVDDDRTDGREFGDRGPRDDRVISLYARGLTVREIQGHLAEIYGTEVSPDLISKITDTVLADAKAWQNRPLERVYPIVYLDALIVKVREGHTVRNQACYVALGVNLDGERDVLGLWFGQTEGAKFWLHVLTDLKTRGVADILFCCVDGLTGFPEAIDATFPHATVQTCLVHQVRSSMRFVSYKDRKPLAADLRKIYTAVNAEHAGDHHTAFAEKWDHRYPMISASWLEHWEQITPFLAYPADVRRVIYTTNSIEALHRQLRKIIKTRGHFPTRPRRRCGRVEMAW